MIVRADALTGDDLVTHERRCRTVCDLLAQRAAQEEERSATREAADPLNFMREPLEGALAQLTRLALPRTGWRWEPIHAAMTTKAWGNLRLAWNNNPLIRQEHPSPIIGVTLSLDGGHLLVRTTRERMADVNRHQLLELQLAIATLLVFRGAMLDLNGLDPVQTSCLIFGNKRARPVLDLMWRTLIKHHGELWYSDNKDALPRQGKRVHEMLDGVMGLRLPAPFCDLPLYHPRSGAVLNLLAPLGHSFDREAREVLQQIREAVTPELIAPLYDTALPADPDTSSAPSPPP